MCATNNYKKKKIHVCISSTGLTQWHYCTLSLADHLKIVIHILNTFIDRFTQYSYWDFLRYSYSFDWCVIDFSRSVKSPIWPLGKITSEKSPIWPLRQITSVKSPNWPLGKINGNKKYLVGTSTFHTSFCVQALSCFYCCW